MFSVGKLILWPHSFKLPVCVLFQDLLFLTCSHPENKGRLANMEEWPEWILEIMISNYEVII